MPRELVALAPRQPVLREYSLPPLQPEQVRIRAEFSAPKHGTELHIYRGISPFQAKDFDMDYHAMVPKKNPGATPFPMPLGNMSIGIVTELGSGARKFKIGDRVYGHLPAREIYTVAEERVQLVPEGLTREEIVCQDPAHFALAAVRDAHVRVGERVAVFGLGAIGLLVVQLAKLSGARWIAAVDPVTPRRQLAKEFGADETLDPTACDAGLEIKKLTGKRGVDVAIEASASYSGLQAAMRATHYSGLVVALAYYQGEGTALRLGEEWHHNRLTLISSMPVWGNPSRDHPMWDFSRIEETVLELLRQKKLRTSELITPVVPFERSAEAYREIDNHPERCVKMGITYQFS